MKLSTQLRAWQGDRTDAKAAEALGVPLRTYHNWKIGHREPRGLALSTVLERISKKKGNRP